MLGASRLVQVQFVIAWIGSPETKVFVQWMRSCSRLTPLTTITELISLVLQCHCVIFKLLGKLVMQKEPSENIAMFYITICGSGSK